MSQSNTQVGDVVRTAGEELTAGLVARIKNSNGSPVAALPDTNTDEAPYVVVEGGAAAANVTLQPLSRDRLARLRLDGVCDPGAQLVLATPDGTVDGMVIALPATPGTYRLVALAEEAGVDGQLVLARPVGQRLITIV